MTTFITATSTPPQMGQFGEYREIRPRIDVRGSLVEYRIAMDILDVDDGDGGSIVAIAASRRGGRRPRTGGYVVVIPHATTTTTTMRPDGRRCAVDYPGLYRRFRGRSGVVCHAAGSRLPRSARAWKSSHFSRIMLDGRRACSMTRRAMMRSL
ncbi:hypothetical protein ACHAXA_008364 [Cyclostephanos tholiformis]|uniref:Uncharacterized protein n=1 Tax=Cyclostephanos tholiformis TaxID=382380 RepID=A0ABD3RVZ3_9STRA